MSCNCGPNIQSFPRSCGVDPCFIQKTSTDMVFYTGDNLSCSSVNKCDDVTLALQKIDTKLCPESIANSVITAITNNTSLLNILCGIVNVCMSQTTTTTTSSSSTTTTTTTLPVTTTTTTTTIPCDCYVIQNQSLTEKPYLYFDCLDGSPKFGMAGVAEILSTCSKGIPLVDTEMTVTYLNPCSAGCEVPPL